jgi:acyl carrier protein
MHKRRAGDASLVGFVTAHGRRDVSEELLREHLAAALPAHMVPSRIIISASLPTTPSGKLDRLALAECELAERLDSDAPPSMTDSLLGTLMHIWTNVLGAPVTNTSTSFFDLGGYSLLVVQMFSEIEQRLGRTCSATAFFKNPTISHLAELLRASADVDQSGLIRLTQGQPGILPLFLVAGLMGSEMDYVHLVDALSDDVPVYALRLRAFRDSEHPHQTLREAARDLADLMQEAQPRGPYAVAGYSASGILALVIAEELRARGESADFVGLIDSAPPDSVPVPLPLTSPRRLVPMLKAGLGRVRELLAGPRALPRIWRRARAAAVRSAARWHVLPIRYELTVDDIFVDMPAKFSEHEI